ncbi:MAG: sulfite exporter TauE/SafE family protein [Burkholderiaceae bacterium]
MNELPAWLVAVAPLWPPFLVGLLGGLHCASMCGGIAAAVGMRSRRPPSGPAPIRIHPRQAPAVAMAVPPVALAGAGQGAACAAPAPGSISLSRLLAYNSGRVATYGLLGALAGSAGSVAWLVNGILPVQRLAFALASIMLILMGAYLLGERRLGRMLESVGAPLWRRLQPLAGRSLAIEQPGPPRLFMIGALWGLVPCAMVYGVLLSALSTGSAAQGAALMLAFGLGTLPNLLALGASAAWLTRLRGLPGLRWVVAALLIVFGLLGLARVLGAPMGPLSDVLCFVPAPGAP